MRLQRCASSAGEVYGGSQARAAACLVIIALVRLLNLAVPIVYKRVIDDMSSATNSNHPPGGGTPHQLKFMQVRRTSCVTYRSRRDARATVGLVINF